MFLVPTHQTLEARDTLLPAWDTKGWQINEEEIHLSDLNFGNIFKIDCFFLC